MREHLRDRLEQLDGHHAHELHLGMQGAGERSVLDDGHAVFPGDLSNRERQRLGALGHDARRRVLALGVAQRHGEVRRVGDDVAHQIGGSS